MLLSVTPSPPSQPPNFDHGVPVLSMQSCYSPSKHAESVGQHWEHDVAVTAATMHSQVLHGDVGDAERVAAPCVQEQSIRANCTTLPVAPSKFLCSVQISDSFHCCLPPESTTLGSSAVCVPVDADASITCMMPVMRCCFWTYMCAVAPCLPDTNRVLLYALSHAQTILRTQCKHK